MEIKRLTIFERWRTIRELKKRTKAINETIRAVSDFVDKLPPLSSQ